MDRNWESKKELVTSFVNREVKEIYSHEGTKISFDYGSNKLIIESSSLNLQKYRGKAKVGKLLNPATRYELWKKILGWFQNQIKDELKKSGPQKKGIFKLALDSTIRQHILDPEFENPSLWQEEFNKALDGLRKENPSFHIDTITYKKYSKKITAKKISDRKSGQEYKTKILPESAFNWIKNQCSDLKAQGLDGKSLEKKIYDDYYDEMDFRNNGGEEWPPLSGSTLVRYAGFATYDTLKKTLENKKKKYRS